MSSQIINNILKVSDKPELMTLTIRLPDSIVSQINKVSKRANCYKQTLLEELIKDGLAQLEEELCNAENVSTNAINGVTISPNHPQLSSRYRNTNESE